MHDDYYTKTQLAAAKALMLGFNDAYIAGGGRQMTVTMSVMYLGETKACAGLIFIGLIRAKRIVAPIIKPMPFCT